jgi:type II restriction enzyme
MPDTQAERINRLIGILRGLRSSQLHWVEKVALSLAGPSEFLLRKRDLLDEVSVQDFGDVLRIHHAFSAEPFTKDKFEYALVQVLKWRGVEAELASKGNRGHDVTIAGTRVSLKTQADKSIKKDEIWISKFMELGKGAWGVNPADLQPLLNAFLEHLQRYDRIFSLRAIGKAPNWHYELIEIPKQLLEQAGTGRLEMRMKSRQSSYPGYCHVTAVDGSTLYKLYFDAGSERKLQVKALRKSACVLHAEWNFTVSAM